VFHGGRSRDDAAASRASRVCAGATGGGIENAPGDHSEGAPAPLDVATDPRLDPRINLGIPWLLLSLALAVHVAEEIATGFLSAYELALESMRQLVPYVRLPHVTLSVWLAITIGVVALLTLLTPLAYRGARGMRTLMLWFIGLELANVAGHVGGAILARRPIPGVYSTAALAAASVYAIVAERRRVAALKERAAANRGRTRETREES